MLLCSIIQYHPKFQFVILSPTVGGRSELKSRYCTYFDYIIKCLFAIVLLLFPSYKLDLFLNVFWSILADCQTNLQENCTNGIWLLSAAASAYSSLEKSKYVFFSVSVTLYSLSTSSVYVQGKR